jgi:hypothetical protein
VGGGGGSGEEWGISDCDVKMELMERYVVVA